MAGTNVVVAVRSYFREVLGELRKTSWPNWETLARHTGVVLLMVVILTAVLVVFDVPLSWGLTKFLGK